MERGENSAIYLFCFVRPGFLPPIEAEGLNEQSPLLLQPFSDVVAVISKVPVEDFSGPAAESKMQDLAWLGPRACRHEAVIEGVIRYSPVVPARFGTIFSSGEALKIYVEHNYEAISKFLDYVADKQEWGIKGMIDKAKAKDERFSILLAEQVGTSALLSPGMRYLQEKRIRGELEKELNRWLEEILKKARSHLICQASDFCERKVLSREVTGLDKDMIVNWAFLVQQTAAGDFQAQIDQLNFEYEKEGLTFNLSGPWPPYSFYHSFPSFPSEPG